MIFGHFFEHFHRQIYGGIYDPGSSLSNEKGFRKDVLEALRNIKTPIIRWPGGCFVSNYHWMDGVGQARTPFFDKAWRVEEPNTFGTDEFVEFCRDLGAEPYICTNAGTGTAEEMSNWVEYCNLQSEGKYAKMRIENGHIEPHNVKYWSIGNENYGNWEIGAKDKSEWGRFVLESAKMMKRVDPRIQIFAASLSNLDWNINLLREAGAFLDWISIHHYWDRLSEEDSPGSYEKSMFYSTLIEAPILRTKYILGSLGFLKKINIAFDEWNLRSWHHPNVHRGNPLADNYLTARDRNDLNSTYTMADAIFNACFLNTCLKHSDVVKMANFSPIVNTRGSILTHKDGILLRSTYYVFELYTRHMGEFVVDSWVSEQSAFEFSKEDGQTVQIPCLDMIATTDADTNDLRISVVNRHPDQAQTLTIKNHLAQESFASMFSILSASKDSFNDVPHPDEIHIHEQRVPLTSGKDFVIEVEPHSVNIIVLR
jgi:alpha-N-arabinofuranosidase